MLRSMMQDVRYTLRQWRRALGFALTVFAVAAPSSRSTLPWFAASLAASYIYRVRVHDTLTFSAVSIVLALSSFLAASLPARRAAAVDPILALRSE